MPIGDFRLASFGGANWLGNLQSAIGNLPRALRATLTNTKLQIESKLRHCGVEGHLAYCPKGPALVLGAPFRCVLLRGGFLQIFNSVT
jgi:hypothetical protein